jgi:hypothetical protein
MENLKISVLQNASRAEIKYDPVPHITIKNCLPENYYKLLEKAYISDDQLITYHSREKKLKHIDQNARVNILFKDVADKKIKWPHSDIWTEFVLYHMSEKFFRELLRLFGPEIKTISPQLEPRLGTSLERVPIKYYEKNIIYDHESSKSIFLDGDIGINTISNNTTSVRKHHVDGMQRIFGGLLYFKRTDDDATGGDLEFYRLKYNQSLTINKSVELNKNQLDFVSRIEYQANTAVFWLNSPNAIHNVTPRGPSKVSRRLVYFSARVEDKTLFYKGLYPHAWPEQEYWFKRIYKDLNPKLIHIYYKIKQLIKKNI